jgi:hypothetical protein
MMFNVNIDEITNWAGLLTVVLTGAGYLARAIFRSFTSNKSNPVGEKMAAVNLSLYDKLQKEVDRLDKHVEGLEKENEELELQLHKLHDIEVDGAADLGMLTAFVDQFPCNTQCTKTTEMFILAQDVLERMNKRREEKRTLLARDSE